MTWIERRQDYGIDLKHLGFAFQKVEREPVNTVDIFGYLPEAAWIQHII